MTYPDIRKEIRNTPVRTLKNDWENFSNPYENIRIKKKENIVKNAEKGEFSGMEHTYIHFCYGMCDNEDFANDLPMIMRNYSRHGARMERAGGELPPDLRQLGSEAKTAFYFISTVFNEAVSGDPFAKQFLIKIYRTYFKEEYNELKHFSHIGRNNIKSLLNTPEDFSPWAVSRIIGMAQFFDIKLDPDIALLTDSVKWYHNAQEDPENISLENKITKEEFSDAWDETDGDSMSTTLRRMLRIINDIEKYYGWDQDHLSYCTGYSIDDPEAWKADRAYIRALLKRFHPKRAYTDEDIEINALLLRLVRTIIMSEKNMTCYAASAIGVNIENNEREHLWTNIDISHSSVYTSSVNDVTETEEDEKDEIEDLVKIQKKRISYLEDQLGKKENDKNELWRENRELAKEIKMLRMELEALRREEKEDEDLPDHSADNLYEPEEASLTEMEETLTEYKVAVIGGRENWVRDFKNKFKKWKFYSAEPDSTLAETVLKNMDMVFFFPDHLSHVNYYKAIGVLRQNNKKYGFLYATNYEINLKTIYRELTENTKESDAKRA